VFAARVTSDNASVYGKYLSEVYLGLPAALAAPSVVTLYERPLRVRDMLVIGLSQSGESTDIVEFVRSCRRQGAVTVAISNHPRSGLVETAHHSLLMRAGPERSVAATKTYLAQLGLLAMLVLTWSHAAEPRRALASLPFLVAQAIDVEPAVRDYAHRYRRIEECLVTSRGFNYATAREAALKLKETCYVAAEALSAADLLHGPIAVVRPHFPVILIAMQGKTLGQLRDVAKRLSKRGADLVVITNDEAALRAGQRGVRLPFTVPEALSPIPAVVPAQLLAYHLSVARGLDPDRPRGLRKVTRTR
jgi:glucosamine--fructose-6-phosphate aminotransferase (isomerizing)